MSLTPAIVAQLVWIPFRYYSVTDATRLMNELQVAPLGYEGRVRQPIAYWQRSNATRMVGLPVEYGINELARLGVAQDLIAEDLSDGHPALFRSRPTPRDADQALFFSDMVQSLQDNYTVLAVAPTGTGKTVAVLNAIASLGRTALIIVDSVVLAEQWRKEIIKHLGLLEHEVGWVQGNVCNYQGFSITVAVIHNLVQKQFAPDFYRYFGFVAWDEGQILGAESFSQSMFLFFARHRITVTATPTRRDGCSKMLYDYFGSPRVIAQQAALPCELHVITYDEGRAYKGDLPMAILLNMLILDQKRNLVIVSKVLEEHHAGRDMLVVSDRIEHLQYLMEWCALSGIPRGEMGLFTRSYVDEQGTQKENGQPYLDWCKRSARVIFATYQMIEKGVDVPRLSSGMDATPRSSATQLIGRIRRFFPGKPTPRWWTLRDTKGGKLISRYKSRMRDYNKDTNITVIH